MSDPYELLKSQPQYFKLEFTFYVKLRAKSDELQERMDALFVGDYFSRQLQNWMTRMNREQKSNDGLCLIDGGPLTTSILQRMPSCFKELDTE